MKPRTNTQQYWDNEVDRQLRIIESLAGKMESLKSEVAYLEKQISQERSVLEGLERIASNSETNGGVVQ